MHCATCFILSLVTHQAFTGIAPVLSLAVQEYFSTIMKKLKQVGATADRTNFYI